MHFRFTSKLYPLLFCGLVSSLGVVHAEILLTSPTAGETISSVDPELRSFLTLSGDARREKFSDLAYRKKLSYLRAPVPTIFSWKCTDGEEGPFRVQISESQDFSKPFSAVQVELEESKEQQQASYANFLLGRTYYWRVEGIHQAKKVLSKVSSFQTDSLPPRLIHLSGVPNVRDLGGWTGLDGRKVRQGMIYRSSGLNMPSPDRRDEKVEFPKKRPGEARITKEGGEYAREGLGWKVDLDLRSDPEVGSMKESPAGGSVRLVHHSSSNYASIFKDSGVDAMVKNFRVFLDTTNYPVDFHCSAGADRAGSLAFILNGLLGVSLDDLTSDWEISASPGFTYEKYWDPMVSGLDKYGKPNDPLHKKIEAWLYEYGVTPQEVEQFRSIMLEPK